MNDPIVFIVDPSKQARNFVCRVANELGLQCEEYLNAENFLAAVNREHEGCVVAEFKLVRMGGIELQETLATFCSSLPVVFMTRFADTRRTVRAMKRGALTVLDKPVGRRAMRKALRKAIARSKRVRNCETAHGSVASSQPAKQESRSCLAPDVTQQLEVMLQQQRDLLAHALQFSDADRAGEVVHELSQPLSVIANYSAIIDSATRQGQALEFNEIREWIAMISNSSKLAADIMGRFHSFAAKRQVVRRDEPLAEIVRDAVQMLRFSAQCHDASIHVESEQVTANVDRVQIQQVLINLLKNAIESVAENEVNDRTLQVKTHAEGNHVKIIVSDNGPGVSESEQSLIFERFLSSKNAGLGLGLAISKSIVEGHDGNIWYEPNHPRGASFHVRLPLAK